MIISRHFHFLRRDLKIYILRNLKCLLSYLFSCYMTKIVYIIVRL